MWKQKISKTFTFILKYKFWFTILFFIFWLTFLDSNNYFFKKTKRNDISHLKKQKQYYENRIKKDSLRLDLLQNNNDELERYAREKYLMKKDNEVLFIVIDKTDR